jgi:hypothetical protein
MRRTKNLAPSKRKTLLGVHSYKRATWHCSCGYGLAPLDRELGVGSKATRNGHAFVSLLVYMCTLLPYEKGCELFARSTGQQASTQLAQRLTRELGTDLYRSVLGRLGRHRR